MSDFGNCATCILTEGLLAIFCCVSFCLVVIHSVVLGILGYLNSFWINAIATWLTVNGIFTFSSIFLLGIVSIILYANSENSHFDGKLFTLQFFGIGLFILIKSGIAIWGIIAFAISFAGWNIITEMGLALIIINSVVLLSICAFFTITLIVTLRC